jgi:hypothetical protein
LKPQGELKLLNPHELTAQASIIQGLFQELKPQGENLFQEFIPQPPPKPYDIKTPELNGEKELNPNLLKGEFHPIAMG